MWLNANTRLTWPEAQANAQAHTVPSYATFIRVQFNLFIADESKTANKVSENENVGRLCNVAMVDILLLNYFIIYAQLMYIAWARPARQIELAIAVTMRQDLSKHSSSFLLFFFFLR